MGMPDWDQIKKDAHSKIVGNFDLAKANMVKRDQDFMSTADAVCGAEACFFTGLIEHFGPNENSKSAGYYISKRAKESAQAFFSGQYRNYMHHVANLSQQKLLKR